LIKEKTEQESILGPERLQEKTVKASVMPVDTTH